MDSSSGGGVQRTAPTSTDGPRGTTRPRGRRWVRLLPAVSLALSVLLLGAFAWSLTRPRAEPVDRLVISGAPRQPAPASFQRMPAGTPAPALRLPDAGDGGTVDLAALRGRPVVVNFWAVWCEPCKREFPLLRQAYARHRADGLEIVGVAVRTDRNSARDYAKVAGARWRIALDPGDRAAAAWRAGLLPQTFFVRPDGTIASHQIGELAPATLDEQLSAILPAGG